MKINKARFHFDVFQKPTKVGEFELAQVADEQVLRFKIPMQNPPAVDI